MKGKPNSKLRELQKKSKEGGICEKCQRKVDYITVDHIIPVWLLECLDNFVEIANNDEENFRLICQPCNKLKGNLIDFTDKRTAHLILKYITPYL